MYESGKTYLPINRLADIAKGLKCRVEDLINTPAEKSRLASKYMEELEKFKVLKAEEKAKSYSSTLSQLDTILAEIKAFKK